MSTDKSIVPLTSQVGPAHPTIQAIHPVSKQVYPVYTAIPITVLDVKGNSNNVAPAAFTFIKGNEIHGPFADAIVARDTCSFLISKDIEHGIVNP